MGDTQTGNAAGVFGRAADFGALNFAFNRFKR